MSEKKEEEDKEGREEENPFEELRKLFQEQIDLIRRHRTSFRNGKKKILVTRLEQEEMDPDETGECDNVMEGEEREKVKAGDTMCGVGMIRKGRSWGDYGGVFCGECPYFIRKRGKTSSKGKYIG